MKRQTFSQPNPVISGLVLSVVAALTIGLSGCASSEDKDANQPTTGSEFSDAGATVVEEVEVVEEVAEWTGISPIYFDFDKSDIRPDAVPVLRGASQMLNETGTRIVIAGHTDNRGTEEYNLALGERRAASARRYLANLGVPMNQMTIVSYGELRPAAQGNTEAAWALNRRDEFDPVQ